MGGERHNKSDLCTLDAYRGSLGLLEDASGRLRQQRSSFSLPDDVLRYSLSSC